MPPEFAFRWDKNRGIDVTGLDQYRAGEAIFSFFDIENINVHSLLFHTGYLTVKAINESGGKRDLYTLTYPNREVKESFVGHLQSLPEVPG